MSTRFCQYVTILFLCLPLVFIGLVQWGAIPQHYMNGGIGRSPQQLQQMRGNNAYTKLEAQPSRIEINPWGVSSTQGTGTAKLPSNPFAQQSNYVSNKAAPNKALASGLEAGGLVAGLFALVFLGLSFSTPAWMSVPVACIVTAVAAFGGNTSQGRSDNTREPLFLLPLIGSIAAYAFTQSAVYTVFVALVFGFGLAIRQMGGNRQALGVDRSWRPTSGGYAAAAPPQNFWRLPWQPGSSSTVSTGPNKQPVTLSRDSNVKRGPGWIAALDPNAGPRIA